MARVYRCFFYCLLWINLSVFQFASSQLKRQAILNRLLGLQKDIYNGTNLTEFGPREPYDSSIAPDFELDVPTKVRIAINIQNIYSVRESAMDFSVDLKLQQSWVDRRLNYTDLIERNSNLQMLEMDNKMMHKVWVPDTYFANEKYGNVHDVTVPNKMMHLFENGTVHYKIRLSLTLSCAMKLHKYPLDEQVCPIVIESYAYTTDNVQFEWDRPRPVIIMEDLTLPQFEPKLGDQRDNCSDGYVAGKFACLQTTIRLQRKVGYYVVQVFVPSILIVVLSWVSFWVDHDAVPARISLGVLTVLTMTTQSSGARQSLPQVSYVKAIDVWMSTCLLFVFVALLEYSYVNVLARRQFKTKVAKKEQPMELQHLTEDDSSRENDTDSPCPMKKCSPDDVIAARKVDKVSRAVFPSVFILFNVAFWTYYILVPDPS